VTLALKCCCFAMLLAASSAAAQQAAPDAAPEATAKMQAPTVARAEVDWAAAQAALAGFAQLTAPDQAAGPAAGDALTRLNAVTEKIFPKIATSSVPVLLPFDTAAFLRDAAAGETGAAAKYLAGFQALTFFYPGPSGYDAEFTLEPRDAPNLDLTFVKRIDVQISGFALVYQLDGPAAAEGSPVRELESDFPGIRRILLESRVRYVFTRFGVPYAVSILCFDGAKRLRRLSCHEADKVAVRFLKALGIVGGAPQAVAGKAAPPTIERPDKISADFTFYAPGDILPGTGMRRQSGRADATVYSRIRFPMAHAPAYTNSQSFMNWGNCDHTGRVRLGGRGKDATYRCRVNTVRLVHDETKNYAYPWRDNFCEHRYFYVGQCPAGLGHQGEDIRPSACKLRNQGADRCEPYQDDVVAVRDGVALRDPGEQALYLVVDAPGEHIRFRYLHMNPHMLDAAGLTNGHPLREGEVLGPVGDYGRREGGTTYHLHFDVQVPTRQGWLFVNPYMTLVAAYERLIGGRGRVVDDAMAAVAATPEPDSSAKPSASAPESSHPPEADVMVERDEQAAETGKSDSERETVSARHCQTRFVKGHRRRHCWTDGAEERGRRSHAHAVRAVDRRVSHHGYGAWHHRGHLHARHGHAWSRHHRA
jgi:hypothetical protein